MENNSIMEIKRIPIGIQILNFLAKQSKPVTIDQIDDEIDCYPNIIASYLKDLTEKGMVVTISDLKPKVYFLATWADYQKIQNRG